MNKIRIFLLGISSFLFPIGCTNEFERIDFPTTSSISTEPDGLFTVATQRGSQTWLMFDRAQRLLANFYVQYNALNGGYPSDYYEPTSGIFTEIWDRSYGDQSFEFAPLFYITKTIEICQDRQNPHKEGIARIWRVFLFQRITDMYGDIPYSEAFKKYQPKFDTQESIYADFISEIKVGKDLMASPGDFPSFGAADLIYQGNRDKWLKFANSLLLRIALRIVNVAPEKSAEILNEIKDGPFMQSNDDSNKMLWDGSVSNIYFRNPILVTEVFNTTKMSSTMIDYLKTNNDPRLSQYAKPAVSDGQYRGLNNGLDPEAESVNDDNYYDQFSRVGQVFLEENGVTYNMHYPEVCFLKAEAAWRGLLPGNPAEFYYEGIRAALNLYVGVTENSYQAYINQQNIQFSQANALELIITQKWVSLCMNGLEAWAEKRRTGFPTLKPISFQGPVNNGSYPRRLIYSESERRLNRTQLELAVTRMGGDTQTVRIWWDNTSN